MSVAIVTDSTASLPAEVARARGIRVVPLQVVIGAVSYDEALTPGADEDGSDGATPELVAKSLREWTPVSTSRPTPAAMLEAYRAAAADAGATSIVSVHLSAEISGTYESAQLAARDSPVPVVPVDSRQVGMATGFAVLAPLTRRTVAPTPPRPRTPPGARRLDDVAVLRRHAGVPAPRRPDGRRGGPARLGAVGEADPADRRRQGRARSSGCVRRARRWPGWRSSRSRPPGPRRSTSRWRTWRARSGPSSSPAGCATGWPTGSPIATSGSVRSAPCSGPTWARAWWRWRSRVRD